MWMNEYDIEDAVHTWRNHAVLGPATRTLENLMRWTNTHSDGWPYWQKPSRAANKLMELVEGDRTWESRFGNREDATPAKLRAALSPIKAFCTRQGISQDSIISA